MLRIAALVWLVSLASVPAYSQDALRLRMTDDMIAAGFDRHILPRFKFRHRIDIQVVPSDGEADMAFVVDGQGGQPAFATSDGNTIRLVTLSTSNGAHEAAATFHAWLTSTPGKSAIDSFAPDGAPVYRSKVAVETPVAVEKVEGDIALGSDLAIVHCGRCHVVDARNRMGGIGSTPSFAALRARSNWSALFLQYYTENPHPSFTQIAGLTQPFTAARPSHVQPVELTISDVEAITAFVETLDPLDLGAPIQSQ